MFYPVGLAFDTAHSPSAQTDGPQISRIRHFHISHNTLCLHPNILYNHCFLISLGTYSRPKRIFKTILTHFFFLGGGGGRGGEQGSALFTITHENRALLTMASDDRFTEIVEEQIPQIINEAIYPQIPRGKQTGALLFSNEAIPKFVDFGNARFENAILRSLITCQRNAVDLSQSR